MVARTYQAERFKQAEHVASDRRLVFQYSLVHLVDLCCVSNQWVSFSIFDFRFSQISFIR